MRELLGLDHVRPMAGVLGPDRSQGGKRGIRGIPAWAGTRSGAGQGGQHA